MKYKVLIVDDEPWALMGIKQFFEEQGEEYLLVGESMNGIEALNIAKETKPDIIVCDIRMPELDGVGLLEELKKFGLNAKVILLSGYAEFEYARKAIQFGAYEYLLKPLNNEEMSACLKRIRKTLKEEKMRVSKIYSHIEQIFDLVHPLESMTFRQFGEKNQLYFPLPYYTVFVFLYKGNIIDGMIQENTVCYQNIYYYNIRIGKDKFVCIFNHVKEDTMQLPEMFYTLVGDCDVCGVSTSCGETDDIEQMLEQAEIALETGRLHQIPCVLYKKNTEYKDALLKSLEDDFKAGHLEKIRNKLENVWEKFCHQEIYIDELTDIYNRCIFLVNKYEILDADMIPEFMDYIQMSQQLGRNKDIKTVFGFLFSENKLCEADEKENTDHYLIQKIMLDIAYNYTENITLNDLANKYYVNPSYLSLLIKKETGENYSKHVMGRRIEKARELLKDAELSIYEVGEQVGYSDYFYFTKIFKKVTGVTPSKYRKNMHK